MTVTSLRRHPIASTAAMALVMLACGAAAAQGIDCDALRQRLAAVNQPDPGREARFTRAIGQQRDELARTQAYSDQIGCGGLSGLFGGAPPQCDGIADHITRMQNNLDTLEAQARLLRNGDPDQVAELMGRYDASCRGNTDGDTAITADPGFMQGDGSASLLSDDQAQHSQGGSKALCVRTCDGGYFPLASSVRGEALDGLQALCSAQCPNTEAKLYTTNDTDDIATAVALDGSPYSALPTAFKYSRTHEAACTCKPAGQSWAQALAKAEQMLGKGDKDVTVTEQMSADMARPVQPTSVPAKKTGRRRSGLPLPAPARPAALRADAFGAQAPTGGRAASQDRTALPMRAEDDGVN